MVSAKGFFTLRQCLFMPVVAQDGQVLFFSYHHIPGEWNNKHLERAWVLLLNKWSLWPQGGGSPGREQLFSVWSHHLLVAILTLDLIVKNIAQTNTVYQEGRRSTEVAFMLCYKPSWVQFLAFSIFFNRELWCCWDLSTAALLRESGQCKKHNSGSIPSS